MIFNTKGDPEKKTIEAHREIELPFIPYPGLLIHSNLWGAIMIKTCIYNPDEEILECHTNHILSGSSSIEKITHDMEEVGWVISE